MESFIFWKMKKSELMRIVGGMFFSIGVLGWIIKNPYFVLAGTPAIYFFTGSATYGFKEVGLY